MNHNHQRPPLFLPRSKLHSIACGRGAGASSRYVDMQVTTASSSEETSSLEFTNIAREELGVLNHYIHKVLVPAMHRDQDDSDDDDDGDANAAVVDADVEGDKAEVIAVDSNSTEGGDDDDDDMDAAQVGGRSKRRAAREAMEQTKQHFLQRNSNEKSRGDDDDEEDESEDDLSLIHI